MARTAIQTIVNLIRNRKKKREPEPSYPAPSPLAPPDIQPQTKGERGSSRAETAAAEGTFVSAKTGEKSGISVGDKTYLGLRPQDVEQIQRAKGKTDLPPIEEAAAERSRKIEGQEFLEERGFYGETRPDEVSLDLGVGGVPGVGAAGRALGHVATEGSYLDLARDAGWLGLSEKEEDLPLITDPTTLRELTMMEIQSETIKETITNSERFGAIVEAIPLVGDLVNKYAGGLVEDPKGNVDTIVQEVKAVGTRATNMREKALTGKMGDPYLAYDQLIVMENDIARMEQRIKQLALQSTLLQSDGDAVNLIEEVILDTRQRIFDAKQSAASGLTTTASDESLFLELMELKS